MSINGTKPAPTRDEIKQRRRRVRDQLELQKVEQLESILWDGFGGSDLWFSMRERYGGGVGGAEWVPISQVQDRKKGQNWPLWRTEMELGELRQKSRIVCQSNDAAICLLGNLQNHIVGKGFTYKCQPKKSLDKSPAEPGTQAGGGADAVVNATQAFVDKFLAVNRWTATINPSLLTSPGVGSRERETVRRTYRDGETFLRLFQADGGMTYVRFVEPEQVTQNGGENLRESDGWSFGIQHAMEPFEDEERRVAYHVAYKSYDAGEDAQGEIVPAAEMVHVKLPDEDAAIKRGTPAFSFDTLDAFVRGTKGQRNLSIAASVQAATAEMWKHNQGTQQQISSIAQGLSQRQYEDPVSGKTKYVDKIDAGSIRRIPFGMEPVPMNFATGSKSEFIATWQADLRAGSRAFQAPEYFTGDASNANYSSTKEAGTPWVIASEVIQTHFGAVFAYVVWKAIAYAVECGLLPPQALQVVELQVEPTAVPPTDPLQAAQENQIYTSIKVKSRATVQMELGLDPDHEDANIEEDEQRFGMGGAGGGNPLAAMMGGDGGGGQQQDGQQQGGQSPPPPLADFQLGESLEMMETEVPPGFSGTITDSLGRRVTFANGKRVEGTGGQQAAAQPARQVAAKPAQIHGQGIDPANATKEDVNRRIADLSNKPLHPSQIASEVATSGRWFKAMAASRDAYHRANAATMFGTTLKAAEKSGVKIEQLFGADHPQLAQFRKMMDQAPASFGSGIDPRTQGGQASGTGYTHNPAAVAKAMADAERLKKLTESLLESDGPGFSGIDANGHKWVNGKQVPLEAATTDDHADTLKALHAASITAAHDPQHVKDVVAKMAATLATPQLKEVAKKFGINNTGSSKAAIADAILRKIVDRREMFQRAQGASTPAAKSDKSNPVGHKPETAMKEMQWPKDGSEPDAVWRVQPKDAELHGQASRTSNDEDIPGIFVFDNLNELAAIDWANEKDVELVKVKVDKKKDLFQTEDQEGAGLKKGRGQIVQRMPFEDTRAARDWAIAKQRESYS